MHIADVDKGMLGVNDIGTLVVPIGQIAAVSTGDGPVTPRQSVHVVGGAYITTGAS
jgi:hypothetical protein